MTKKQNNQEEQEEKTRDERIEEGQILARTIIEMLGAPKEHIEKTMEDYIEKMKENKDYQIVNYEINEAVEQEPTEQQKKQTNAKKLYSTYAELEIWFKGIDKLAGFCFDSLPSSIEILDPGVIKFKGNELSSMLNDLQAKLHYLDMALKTQKTDMKAVNITFKTLVQNFVNYCLKQEDMDAEKLSKITGINQKKIENITKELEEKKIIHKKGNNYSLN